MSQVIIYENDEGGVSIIYPTEEALSIITIEQIAEKDVPDGKPFFIIDSESLPSRESRNAWIIQDGIVTAP